MASNAALALERVIGVTTLHNCALSSHSSSGEVAYAAGCVVVLYHPKKNKQTRYLRASKPISSISFSQNGKYLAVGERGLKPAVIIWEIKTGVVISELKGHKYGIISLCWSPDSKSLVSAGFKFDKQLILWQDLSNPNTPVEMKMVAKTKVSNRICAVRFSRDGLTFVSCGEKHVKWWKFPAVSPNVNIEPPVPKPSDPLMPPPPPEENESNKNLPKAEVAELKGKSSSLVESHKDATFVDVACGVNGKCFSLTSEGTLCSFDEKLASLTSFVSLDATNAYCISLQQPYSGDDATVSSGGEVSPADVHALVAVGCSDGLIRVFDSFDLGYLVTLPQPPPAGYLNFKSVDELSKLTNLHREAYESFNLEQSSSEAPGLQEAAQAPPVLSYPACVALRWLNKAQPIMNPPSKIQSAVPPTHLVAIYGDRSLFVWDISKTSNPQQTQGQTSDHPPILQNELVIGKYRSSQNHSSCIWDVRPMPSSYGPGYGSMFFSCAADNTVRLWCIDATPPQSAQSTDLSSQSSVVSNQSVASNPRVLNFFSKELVHAFSCRPLFQSVQGDECDVEELAKQKYIQEKYNIPPPSNMGDSVLVSGELDVESPCRVDHPSQAGCPRVLAVSPNGDEVACGDRMGNLRIWAIKNQLFRNSSLKHHLYDLVYSATAHDAEVLCLDYTFQCEVNKSNQVIPLSSHPQVDATEAASNQEAPSDGWMSVLLASGGRDRLIHVLGASHERYASDMGEGNDCYQLLQTLEHHESAVTSLKFSSNGKKLFSIGAEGTLSLSKVNPKPSPQEAQAVEVVEAVVGSTRNERIHRYRSVPLIYGVSYDVGSDITGKYVVCAGQTDSKLHIYSSTSGKHLRSYTADPNEFNSEEDTSTKNKVKKSVASELYKIDLCPAGMYLATCSFDRWIRLIDFYSGQIVAQVSGHAELVTSLRFSQDGKRLISSGGDGCVFIWKLNSQITNAMNDRIAELKHLNEEKRKNLQEEVNKVGSSSEQPSVQVIHDSGSNTKETLPKVVNPPESSDVGTEFLPSPPDVREARLIHSNQLFTPSDDDVTGDMTPPRQQSPSHDPSIEQAMVVAQTEEAASSNAMAGRVLQGKWAEGVQASGGGYNLLGKYHVSPRLEKQTKEGGEVSVQQTIMSQAEVDEMNRTLFSTTTHFKEEDIGDTPNGSEQESDARNKVEEEDQLMKSIEDEDGVIVAESPKHVESVDPFSFGDTDDSLTEDEKDGASDITSISENEEETTGADGPNKDVDSPDKKDSPNDEGGEDEEEMNHGNTWLGDEVRSSWRSVDIEAVLSKPKESLQDKDIGIQALSTTTDSHEGDDDKVDTKSAMNSPSGSVDILSFSATFRRSSSSLDSSKKQRSKKTKKPKLKAEIEEGNDKVESSNKTASPKNQSENDDRTPLFESPQRQRAITPMSKEEDTAAHASPSKAVSVQPPTSGGGFSTPSKESRRKPPHSFEHQPVSSSAVSRGSTSSSRTLGEERERLRNRDKRRDTASALADMNDQLMKMGILKQVPCGSSIPPTNSAVTSSKAPVTSSMPNLVSDKLNAEPTVSRPSTANPVDSRSRSGSSGGYISPDESVSPLQSLQVKKDPLQSSLATTVSATSEENEENDVESASQKHTESEVVTSEEQLSSPSSIKISTSVSSSTASLPRPLSEYRKSLQRLQEAVVETARLYQELQYHTLSSDNVQHSSTSPLKSPRAPSQTTAHTATEVSERSPVVSSSIGLPSMVASPSRVTKDKGSEGSGDALNLLGEFAATWESVGGLVAHSQSFASNPAVGSSMSSLSSDSFGSFSSFSLNQPFSLNNGLPSMSADPSAAVANGTGIGLPPILERGESALDANNSSLNNESNDQNKSNGKGAVTPPSRPAPPPPMNAESESGNHEVMSPTFDNQFEGPVMKADVSKGLSVPGMTEPSPEVSMILEKYSDVLLGMVQQKLQLSQSSVSLHGNSENAGSTKTSPEKPGSYEKE